MLYIEWFKDDPNVDQELEDILRATPLTAAFLSPKILDLPLWVAQIKSGFEKLKEEVNKETLACLSCCLVFLGKRNDFFNPYLPLNSLDNTAQILILIGKELGKGLDEDSIQGLKYF